MQFRIKNKSEGHLAGTEIVKTKFAWLPVIVNNGYDDVYVWLEYYTETYRLSVYKLGSRTYRNWLATGDRSTIKPTTYSKPLTEGCTKTNVKTPLGRGRLTTQPPPAGKPKPPETKMVREGELP